MRSRLGNDLTLGLAEKESLSCGLFDADPSEGAEGKVIAEIDALNRKYGRSVIRLASSDKAARREEAGERPLEFMPKGFYKKLSVPYLGDVH